MLRAQPHPFAAAPSFPSKPPRLPFTACDQCRRCKTRCDDQAPCSRCVRSGLGAACSRLAEDDMLEIPQYLAEYRLSRRATKACLSCQLKKVRCGDSRPCARCYRMGLTCDDEPGLGQEALPLMLQRKREQVVQACERCRRSRLKCDSVRPYGGA
ncbi:hypothetical protein GUITHDRAFT_106565 [Guillardia theta CCMP2712]|uniref:Zn(2)-C6 fungal-type domain-containing protein n=1 Tax=Guillardia theta (strain CCMP2712) TaxID=905079 RepID=L1JGD0_GUITC|nr:hypothetical protein GUITHDRAFT_106565 [Guillardia theta CCMP2712]EKX47578.1 hypothetical protein GUITHDRAFT_106565 [Guillardia theta CCMP2712]|eukprot:XP_005834558.1 hypothetical protein GUITHDRAFT_106565 [Guillardia theta CCMP2712]